MENRPEEQSPIAIASQWTTRITTVSLEMVLPGIFGYWVDTRLGTTPLFILVGFAVGMTTAIWHLIRMTNPSNTQSQSDTDTQDAQSPNAQSPNAQSPNAQSPNVSGSSPNVSGSKTSSPESHKKSDTK